MNMKSTAKKSIKKRIFILAVAALLLLSIGFFCFKFFAGEKAKGSDLLLMQSYSISLTPPEDGTGPQDHGALENIGYIIGKLSSREYYHTESVSVANASALGGMVNVKQNVVGSKDYKDGIYIVAAISTGESSFAPSKAMQRFYGKDTALVRYAESDKKSDWNGLSTKWSTEKPAEVLDKAQHINRYGLWATEFCDYVITEQTLLTPDATVEKDGDGYVLTVSLSVRESAEEGKKDATEYYKRQMRTMGDLDDYPSFASAQLIFRFEEDWTITSLETAEEYSSKKGFEANCKGSNKTTYSYDLADVDVSAYETYFINYADSAVTQPEEEKLTALDYLSSGFAPLLTQEQSLLKLEANVGATSIVGDAALSMQNGQFGGLRLSLGDLYLAYEGESIFLQYRDFFGKLALAECASFLPDLGGLDLASLESAIGEGKLTETDTGAQISCSLPLGELILPLDFTFVRDENGIRWSSIDTQISSLGIALHVEPGTAEVPARDVTQATDLAPFVKNILSLVEGKEYVLNVSYADQQISVKGELLLDLRDGLALKADLVLGWKDLSVPVQMTVIGENIWLSAEKVAVSTTVSELKDLLSEVLSATGMDLSLSLDASQILQSLLSADYSAIIQKLVLNENGLAVAVDADALLEMFAIPDVQLSLGTAELSYDVNSNSFAGAVLGAEFSLCGGSGTVTAPENAAEYVPLQTFLQFVGPVRSMIQAKDIAFAFGGKVNVQNFSLQFEAEGEVWFADGIQIYLRVLVADEYIIEVYERDGNIQLALNGYRLDVAASELKTVADSLSSLFAGSTEASSEEAALLLFSADGIDLQALLSSIRFTLQQENALGVALDLSALLQGAAAEGIVLGVTENNVTVQAGRITLFGAELSDFSLTAGAAENTYSPDLSANLVCRNLFEFLFNAYTQVTKSDDLSLSLIYDTDELYASVAGYVNLEREEGSAQVTLNLSFTAEIYEGGKQSPTGTHFISLTILRDMLYIGYSTVGMDSGNPLLVKMPVAQLIACGKTVLPILSPILGIREDVYYYNFVISILGGYVETINTAVFGVMNTQEWCDLILGIVGEYAGTGETSSAPTDVSLDTQKKEIAISLQNIALVLSAKEMPQIEAPASAEKYIDISTIANLLQDLEYSYRYADTGGYTLKGTFTIRLTLIGIQLIELPLSVELRVGFEEGETLADRAPYFYIKTFVPKTKLLFDIVNADTLSEIVVRGGNVYILRHVVDAAAQSQELYREYTGSSEDKHWPHIFSNKTIYHYDVTTRSTYERQSAEYRAMTLNDFIGGGAQNVVEQLAYILNFSTFLKDTIIDNLGSSSSDTQESVYDAGDMVTSYQYIAAGGTEKEGYALSLNLAAVTGSDALGSLNAKIERTFSREEDGVRYYDLSALDVSLDMIGGMATVNGKLTHEDPGSDSRADSITAEMMGIFASNGVSVTEGTIAEGSFSVSRSVTIEYTSEQTLCTSCDKSEAERWGQGTWRYDEESGNWIRLA